MHESISMMVYVYLDPVSAQGSQRVYMEQQYPNGLIGYRHGPRGPQVIHTGELLQPRRRFSRGRIGRYMRLAVIGSFYRMLMKREGNMLNICTERGTRSV